jgi:hypothetical protein
MVSLVNSTKVAPASEVNGPPQELLAFGVAATLIWPGVVGKVSVKPTPVIGVELGFVSRKVSVDIPPE